MRIEVACPNPVCRWCYRVNLEHAEQVMRCMKCGARFRVGAPPPPALPARGSGPPQGPYQELPSELLASAFLAAGPNARGKRADRLNDEALRRIEAGRPAEAEALLDEVLALVPGHGAAEFNRTMLQWRTAQLTDLGAARRWREAVERRPGDWEAWVHLGCLHLERADDEAAGGCFEEALRRSGDEVQRVTQIGLKLARLGLGSRALAPLPVATGPVHAVALSADGSRAVTGDDEGAVRVWDLATGTCAITCRGHERAARAVALTPDGRWIATGGGDGLVKLWSGQSGECVRTFEGHGAAVTSVSTTPDGRRIASAGKDGTVRVWRSSTSECVRTWKPGAEAIRGVALTPNARLVAGAGEDGLVRVWDLATGVQVAALEGHRGPALCVAWSADGRFLASGGRDRTVRVWDVGRGALTRVLEGHENRVTGVAWGAGDRRLYSSGADRTVRLWKPRTGRCLRTFEHAGGLLAGLAVSPDGRRILAAGADGVVAGWDAGEGHEATLVASTSTADPGEETATVLTPADEEPSDPVQLSGLEEMALSVMTLTGLRPISEEVRRAEACCPGYSFHRLLSAQGEARVFRATRRSDGLAVAVKFLEPPEQSFGTVWESFQRETSVLDQVRHPHVLTPLDRGRTGRLLYLVTEYCASGSLRELCARRGGRLALDEAVPLAIQLLEALAAVHAAGFVHCNITARNVLLVGAERKRSVRLGGFGRAARITPLPGVVPPEQTADVRAAGELLFRALIGDLDQTREASGRSVRVWLTHLPECFASPIDRARGVDAAPPFLTASAFHEALSLAWGGA